jgi:hypothetical protein
MAEQTAATLASVSTLYSRDAPGRALAADGNVRLAVNLRFAVTLMDDATVAFEHRDRDGALHCADSVHRVNVASLDGEFCAVLSAAPVLRGLAPAADRSSAGRATRG